MLIQLTQGQFAIIDDEDAHLVTGKWHARWSEASKTFYAQTNVRVDTSYNTTQMHRVIMGIDDRTIQVDHKNHNGLDNRRENLRIATGSQNMANARSTRGVSVHRGISVAKECGAWRSQISIDGKTLHLGYYVSEIEAAQAYNNAAIVAFGEFATLNDVPEGIPTRRLMRDPVKAGVSFHKQRGKWRAYVYVDGKQKHLGLFSTEKESLVFVRNFTNREYLDEHSSESSVNGIDERSSSVASELE